MKKKNQRPCKFFRSSGASTFQTLTKSQWNLARLCILICYGMLVFWCSWKLTWPLGFRIYTRLNLIFLKNNFFSLKFVYSEEAIKFCEIFPSLLTACTVVKSKMKILQNFVAFSEYMNFTWVHFTTD